MKRAALVLFVLIFLSRFVIAQDTIFLKNPGNIIKNNLHPILYNWADTAVNYKVVFRGTITAGADDIRQDDGELQVNVVMRNGLVVPLKWNGSGVITNTNSPANRMYIMNITGESPYVTNLTVGFVEVIYYRKPLNTNPTPVERARYQNYQPDQWDFVDIKLSGKIVYTNPTTGIAREIATANVLTRNVQRKMSYACPLGIA